MKPGSNLFKGFVMKISAQVQTRQAIYKSLPGPVIDYPISFDDWSLLVTSFKIKIQRLKDRGKNHSRTQMNQQFSSRKCKVREPLTSS